MSRPLRIEYPGAYYHVMNRGLTDQPIFVNDRDCFNFLGLIEDAWRRWHIRVFSWCLMGNHYHLALQTPEGNLQRVMRHIDGVYTQRFNRNHNREGPLFRGRYKAILIHGDEYVAAVVRYIHLNPVEAKKVSAPQDYRWSSHHDYLKPDSAPEWMSLREILSTYHSPAEFHKFVLSGNEELLLKFYSRNKRPPVLGHNDLATGTKDEGYFSSSEHVRYETTPFRPGSEAVLEAVARVYGVNETALLSGRRGQRNEARKVAMYMMRELCTVSLGEIAQTFHLRSYGGVGSACSIIGRRAGEDRDLKQRIQEIRARISRKV